MRKQLIPVLLVSTLLGVGVGVPPAKSAPATPPTNPGPHVMHFRSSQKGRLGIVVLAISPELRTHFGAPDDRGVLVDAVRPDSPASRAGLLVGDVVTDVDGAATTDARDVLEALTDRKKGDAVTITLMRDGKRAELTARLENDPQQAADSFGGWFKFNGDADDLQRSFEEMEQHMRELQRQFGPGASHSNKI